MSKKPLIKTQEKPLVVFVPGIGKEGVKHPFFVELEKAINTPQKSDRNVIQKIILENPILKSRISDAKGLLTIREKAETLASEVRNYLRKNSVKEVIFVCHSQGGLTGQTAIDLLQDLGLKTMLVGVRSPRTLREHDAALRILQTARRKPVPKSLSEGASEIRQRVSAAIVNHNNDPLLNPQNSPRNKQELMKTINKYHLLLNPEQIAAAVKSTLAFIVNPTFEITGNSIPEIRMTQKNGKRGAE